jgi:hypothetical protein
VTANGPRSNPTGDAISIMTGERDRRFTVGLSAILAGTVRADPTSL